MMSLREFAMLNLNLKFRKTHVDIWKELGFLWILLLQKNCGSGDLTLT